MASLKRLGFKELPSRGGSARHFERESDQEILTFHEPHGGQTLKQGTLTEYLRKLRITREKFEDALRPTITLQAEAVPLEDRFRRAMESDGTIISNCSSCFEVIHKSKIEDEIIMAEASHICPQSATA